MTMIIFSQRLSYAFTRIMTIILAISCLTILSACDSKEVTDESTLGNNNAAQTNPDKIERNSMDNVANAGTEERGEQNMPPTTADQ